jgi:hypothetical protein
MGDFDFETDRPLRRRPQSTGFQWLVMIILIAILAVTVRICTLTSDIKLHLRWTTYPHTLN